MENLSISEEKKQCSHCGEDVNESITAVKLQCCTYVSHEKCFVEHLKGVTVKSFEEMGCPNCYKILLLPMFDYDEEDETEDNIYMCSLFKINDDVFMKNLTVETFLKLADSNNLKFRRIPKDYIISEYKKYHLTRDPSLSLPSSSLFNDGDLE